MQRIKKIILLMLAVLMLAGCEKENTKAFDVNQVLYDNGMEIVGSMAEQAKSEEYISFFSGDKSVAEKAAEVGRGDYSEPKSVYKLTISQEDMANVINLFEMEISQELPESLREDMAERVANAVASLLNSQGGVVTLATSSVIKADACFVCEGITEATFCIFTFQDAYPIMVTYTPGKDGAVYAVGTLLLNDEYKNLEEKEISDILSIMYLTKYDLEIIK